MERQDKLAQLETCSCEWSKPNKRNKVEQTNKPNRNTKRKKNDLQYLCLSCKKIQRVNIVIDLERCQIAGK